MTNTSCVQCGFCCKKCACDFGEWDEENHRCKFLTKDNKCSEYNKIIKVPGSKMNPAFGAGCCMSLFNEDREKKKRELCKTNNLKTD